MCVLWCLTGATDFTARATRLQACQVLSCLASAPLLADLAVWSDWDSLYGPAFGSLKRFIAGCSTAELGFQVLEMPGGRLLKLPPATVGSDLAALRAGWQTAVQQVRGLLSLVHMTIFATYCNRLTTTACLLCAGRFFITDAQYSNVGEHHHHLPGPAG